MIGCSRAAPAGVTKSYCLTTARPRPTEATRERPVRCAALKGPHVVSDPPTAHSLTRAFVEGAGDRHAIHCRDEWRVAKVLPIFSTTAPVAFAASRRRPTCESRARDRILQVKVEAIATKVLFDGRRAVVELDAV